MGAISTLKLLVYDLTVYVLSVVMFFPQTKR